MNNIATARDLRRSTAADRRSVLGGGGGGGVSSLCAVLSIHLIKNA